jgi:hypothetical protein
MALEYMFQPKGFYDIAFEKDFSRDFQLRILNIGNRSNMLIQPEDNVFIMTASLPKYKIHNQPTKFMGMNFNLPGSADYEGNDAWTVKFRCDLPFDIRHAVETWQHQVFTQMEQPLLQSAVTGGGTGLYNLPDMGQTVEMILHDRTGNPYRQYKLVGCYPISIGEMTYDQTGNGTVRELEVTLAYQWWELIRDDYPVMNS